jgi:hypothetical protein
LGEFIPLACSRARIPESNRKGANPKPSSRSFIAVLSSSRMRPYLRVVQDDCELTPFVQKLFSKPVLANNRIIVLRR